MSHKLLAGSVLAGLSVVAEVLNVWLRHVFVSLFYVGKGQMLEGGGSFSTAAAYAEPTTVGAFVGTRVVIWVGILAGFALLAWGVYEDVTGR